MLNRTVSALRALMSEGNRIHSFTKYSLRDNNVSDTILGTKELVMYQQARSLLFRSLREPANSGIGRQIGYFEIVMSFTKKIKQEILPKVNRQWEDWGER